MKIQPVFKNLTKPANRAYLYSIAAHLSLLIVILIFSYHPLKIFTFGTAVQSTQQVQIVNATLVLPTPSRSTVIAQNPPAPAPSTPPSKALQPSPNLTPAPTAPPLTKPAPLNPSILEKASPDSLKTAPQKSSPTKAASLQKPQPPAQPPTSAQNKVLLQKLKTLGLSSLQQAVNSTQQEAASAAQAAKDLSLQEQYMGLIQQTIRSNWINQFDPTVILTVTLKISLDQNGNVLSVSISQTSGNPAFDRQAILAVKKSSPLPLPADARVAKDFANLNLPFSNQPSA